MAQALWDDSSREQEEHEKVAVELLGGIVSSESPLFGQMCRLSVLFCVNDFSQVGQEKGFSPV